MTREGTTSSDATSGVRLARPAADAELALYERALAASVHAYAPYSGLAVGAALSAASGVVYVGVNVENASYPVGMCAERVALGALATTGEREIVTVAVASQGVDILPCGGCLQAMAEFGDPLVIGSAAGEVRTWRLSDLLTAPFGRGWEA